MGIKHIRSRVHKPTTTGKIEGHHLTFINEIHFCGGDLEMFRYRYNHIRPHRSLFMKTPAEVYFDLQYVHSSFLARRQNGRNFH